MKIAFVAAFVAVAEYSVYTLQSYYKKVKCGKI